MKSPSVAMQRSSNSVYLPTGQHGPPQNQITKTGSPLPQLPDFSFIDKSQTKKNGFLNWLISQPLFHWIKNALASFNQSQIGKAVQTFGAFQLAFVNELAAALTASGWSKFKNFYPETGHSPWRMPIDIAALTGNLLAAIQKGHDITAKEIDKSQARFNQKLQIINEWCETNTQNRSQKEIAKIHAMQHQAIADFEEKLHQDIHKAKAKGMLGGICQGINLLIFSFLITNKVINSCTKWSQNLFNRGTNNIAINLFGSIIGIGLLEAAAILTEHFVIPIILKLADNEE